MREEHASLKPFHPQEFRRKRILRYKLAVVLEMKFGVLNVGWKLQGRGNAISIC
jgi:hypothetical protein